MCSPDPRIEGLRKRGYEVHAVDIDRQIIPARNMRTVLELVQLMRRERYDLVHTHAPVASVLGRIAAKIAGIPRIVYTAHGFYFHEHMPPRRYAFYHGVERGIATITDRILVQSQEDHRTAIESNLCAEDKIRYLGNGIDLNRFDPRSMTEGERRALRAEIGLPEDGSPVIGITGRITEEKGFGELVSAVAKLRPAHPKLRLLVIGGQLSTERDAFQERLLGFIEEHGLAEHVVFAGFRNDVHRLLSLLDLFVLPSYREGLPRSVLEAMAMDLPVVATDIRGCREAVAHGKTGLIVPPRDTDRLAAAMGEILSDASLARAFGVAGRERVQGAFDERFVFQRLEDCYRELGVSFG